jgi:multidrug efflux pump subunit AcrB
MHGVEKEIGDTPEVAAWSRLTGARSGSGLELTEPNQGDILVRLKRSRARGAEAVMDDLRARVNARYPQVQADLAQMLQDGIGDIAGAPQPIEVKLFGEDPTVLQDLSEKVGDLVAKVPGVVDVNNGIVRTGPETIIQVDSARASRFGMSTADVTVAAAAAMQGTVATRVQQGEQAIAVRVRPARAGEYVDPLTIPDLLVSQNVRLRSVASMQTAPGQAEVTRENQQPMVSVTGRLEGRDLGSAVAEIKAKLAGLALPRGYRIEYGGLYASQQQSFLQLAIVLLLAIMLISSLLLIQFKSYAQVIALMVASVFSQSGVFLALWLTGIPLNISSMTGAIMIIGVITENGVFLFDTFNSLPGSVEDRLVEAGQHRLRPILMTKIGAILAMLPLALGIGAGAAMQQPLAVAVIGGLCVATFLTLLVAPSLYVLLTSRVR